MRKVILFFTGMLVFFYSCKKETPATAQTIRDTVYVTVHDTTVIPVPISDTATTCIIVRHAEKEATGADPNLDADGHARAEELKRILEKVPVKNIYTTPFNRTRQTVQPLAAAKGVTVSEYATTKTYPQLVDEILSSNRGKVAVIAGHSNTVPEILKELSNNAFNVSISESQYDNLFIVTVPDKLSPTVTHVKYGKATP